MSGKRRIILKRSTAEALGAAFKASACAAGQIAADCPSIPIGSLLTMLERATHPSGLYLEGEDVVLDYSRISR